MTKVRFAPSPTGYLHIGNVRTALINWLFAKQQGGQFILRMDDTDPERSKDAYEQAICEDLTWLGLTWDEMTRQKERLDAYEAAKQRLVDAGRLYPCYETAQEIEVKRKMLLGRGKPPIYDRAALQLSDADKQKLEAEGRTPHWRFLLNDTTVVWDDLVRGPQKFEGRHMSDPVLIREDGSPTYMLPSCVDDIAMGITHILRGEDHVNNTAIQMQLFEALDGTLPQFGHTSLLKTKEGGMSKRTGGFDIQSLRAEGIEPQAITSLLARLGTSEPVEPRLSTEELAQHFSLSQFGKNPANYDKAELERLNAKIVSQLSYDDVKDRLALNVPEAEARQFWETVRPNLTNVSQAAEWWTLCHQPVTPAIDQEDTDFAEQAAALLPNGQWDDTTWDAWISTLKTETGRKGKGLFMPIRKALTGMEHGPELKNMLPLIGRERAMQRLQGKAA